MNTNIIIDSNTNNVLMVNNTNDGSNKCLLTYVNLEGTSVTFVVTDATDTQTTTTVSVVNNQASIDVRSKLIKTGTVKIAIQGKTPFYIGVKGDYQPSDNLFVLYKDSGYVALKCNENLTLAQVYEVAKNASGGGSETYSDFEGCGVYKDGKHGLVPAPVSDDVATVLCSNGKWGIPVDSYSIVTTNSSQKIVLKKKTGVVNSQGVEGTKELVRVPLSVATSEKAGIITADDKKKLDSTLTESQTKELFLLKTDAGNPITALSVSGKVITYTFADGTTGTITTQDTTYSEATQSKSGLLSASDKKKLDSLSSSTSGVTQDDLNNAKDEVLSIANDYTDSAVSKRTSVTATASGLGDHTETIYYYPNLSMCFVRAYFKVSSALSANTELTVLTVPTTYKAGSIHALNAWMTTPGNDLTARIQGQEIKIKASAQITTGYALYVSGWWNV